MYEKRLHDFFPCSLELVEGALAGEFEEGFSLGFSKVVVRVP